MKQAALAIFAAIIIVVIGGAGYAAGRNEASSSFDAYAQTMAHSFVDTAEDYGWSATAISVVDSDAGRSSVTVILRNEANNCMYTVVVSVYPGQTVYCLNGRLETSYTLEEWEDAFAAYSAGLDTDCRVAPVPTAIIPEPTPKLSMD